jgi:transposase
MAYSKDLREKILEYIEKGHEHKQACRIFGVGLRTITRWKKLKSETGSLNTKKLNRKPRKYDSEKLTAYITKNPFAYLKDIAEFFKGSSQGVSAALARLKINLKNSCCVLGA